MNAKQDVGGEASELLYLGDSHVRYLRRAGNASLLYPRHVSGLEVGGATAVGMRNPNAKTNALGRFRTWIADKPRDSAILLHLGEVDCGFVIWYRAARYAETVAEQTQQSIDAYFAFVDELIDHGFHRILVTGATLPTITDSDQIGEVVEKRSSIDATQRQRTRLTLNYNLMLEQGSAQRWPYVRYTDISEDALDPVTGLVQTYLRNTNPQDHHMDSRIAATLWARRIRETLSSRHPASNSHDWVHLRCTHQTYAKALPEHSKRLRDNLRTTIELDQTVRGVLIGTRREYFILESMSIDGISKPWLRFLHRKHFTRLAP